MEQRELCLFFVAVILVSGCGAMTKQQLKNSVKLFKKQCLAKVAVSEDDITDINKGKFIENKDVMCYIACVYQMMQITKNNKLSYEASIKQVNLLYPPEMKDVTKAAIEECKDVSKSHKDLCAASYWTAKCMYDFNPKEFFFP